MSFGRHRRRDGDAHDRLFAVLADAPDTDGAVWDLLAAATAPPRRRELAGEEAAVAAFRAARDRSVTVAPVRIGRVRRLTASATTWIAVLTAAAATAGAAVAASTQDGEPVPRPPIVQTSPPPSPTPTAPPTRPSPSRPAPSTAAPTPRETDPGADLGPFTRRLHTGLCRLYLAKDPDHRRWFLDHPSMRRVIEAAGGRDRVTGYCLRLVAASPTNGPGSAPGHPFVPPGRGPFGAPSASPKANSAAEGGAQNGRATVPPASGGQAR
nr:hypothetical protein [Micromonospora sp. DSM 115978]